MIFQRLWLDYAPPFYRGRRWISTFYESLGAVLDTEAQRVLDGRLAAIPYAGRGPGAAKLATGQRIECAPDALEHHANDRGIKLYDTEPEWSKRYRLSRWYQLHSRKGTPLGEMMNVQPYFLGADGLGSLPTIRIVHRAPDVTTWHTLAPDGEYSKSIAVDNFDYAAGDDAQWSQQYAFIEMSESDFTGPPLYGNGHLYGTGVLYGTGGANPLSAQAKADLASMFMDWDSGHSWWTAIILNWGTPIDVTATPTQDADGRWSLPTSGGHWYPMVDASTGLATRPPRMQWIYENIPP